MLIHKQIGNYIMEKKFEFTGEVNQYGHKRIRALRDIPTHNVKKGDLGGFIESEKNLRHNGDCWVSDNACVYGNAIVWDNVNIYGNAKVFNNGCVYGDAIVFGTEIVWDNANICS